MKLNAIQMALMLFVVGCSQQKSAELSSSSEKSTSDWQSKNQRQFDSLTYVFYNGNPIPAKPTEEELEQTRVKLTLEPEWETKALTKLYGQDLALKYFATKDTDGDGVLDYGISEYHGKFSENDVDIDGDGIRNVLDSDPYNPRKGGIDLDHKGRNCANSLNGSTTNRPECDGHPDAFYLDTNGNTIPDHVDWALQGKSTRSQEVQLMLYKKHKVILVERTIPWTSELVESVHDSFFHILTGVLGESPVVPMLRTVATERWVLLGEEDDDGTYGMVSPRSQTMFIYGHTINAAPLLHLGLLVHEFTHSIQYSMDYFGPLNNSIKKQPSGQNFLKMMENYGWQSKKLPEERIKKPELFVGIYDLFTENADQNPDIFKHSYRGRNLHQWKREFEAKNRELGDGKFMKANIFDANFIPNEYALSNPWEFYSDSIISYLFTVMQDQLVRGLPFAEKERAIEKMRKIIHRTWPNFEYENSRNGPMFEHFTREIQLKAVTVDLLNKKYLK